MGEKTRQLIKKWSENECKKDASLSLIESLYKDLRDEGYSFESSDQPAKQKVMFSKDPNVVHTEQEEADIAKGGCGRGCQVVQRSPCRCRISRVEEAAATRSRPRSPRLS